MLAWPAAALAQTSATNPLSPGFPQESVPTPTTTTAVPTVSTTATAGGGSAFTGNSAIVIAIGALIMLGGISLFIWRDARRRAPTRARSAALEPGAPGSRKGTKQRAKPRKLSPAERRRRKRGRAR